MFNPDDRPLGAVAESAYEILCEVSEPAEGFPVDEARTELEAADFTTGDIDHVLDRLLNRGYLYEVDGELYVTEREDTDESS